MTPVPRPEQGAATLRQALGAVLDEHIGWQMHRGQMVDALAEAAESILAARQSDTGLREAVETDNLRGAGLGEVMHDRGSEPESGWFILGVDGYFDVDNACWCQFQDDDAPWTSEGFELFGTIPALLARFPATPEPEAAEVEEWGVRCSLGIYGPVSKDEARNDWASGWHHDTCVGPRSLVRRTRTTFADRVTEWEEVDE